METIVNLLSWQNVVAVAVLYIAYLITRTFYRLILHPLAAFPGPKLAAISGLYEAYYDVYLQGQYTFKIKELHQKYGPIVRISPYELHVNDPAFFEILYRQDAHYDKYAWSIDAFDAKGAFIFTASHDLHKARRQPLNSFFSKAKVNARQDLIHKHLDKLCLRISKYADDQTTFDLGAATTAFARDAANDFIIGKNYGSLDRDDFDVPMIATSAGGAQMWHLTKQVRWFTPTLKKIPMSFMMKHASKEMKTFFQYLQLSEEDTRHLLTTIASPNAAESKEPRTIVHEILNSKLPPSEKQFERVFEDLSLVTGAGFETVASVLRLVLFHVFSRPDILQRLRTDLANASTNSSQPLNLKTLEQLPYLTAVLMEGLRLSPALATRMARVSPNADIVYDRWRIPPGTAVGMTLILMHTDETIYPDPMRFDPERWMDPTAHTKVDKTFAPFSRGTRNCIGLHFAWAEMYIFVATVVQRFNFQFTGATAEDFECVRDNFAIGTRGAGVLKATASTYQA